ncbi:MAG: FAD-binding oxidoreductase [Pirellulaceae bacterium]
MTQAEQQNFGRNITIHASQVLKPGSEEALLESLRDKSFRSVRVNGRMHSWSQAIEADDVLIDLSRMNHVEVIESNGTPVARVGAGTQIKQVVSELLRIGNCALPSMGLIDEQTIAGAISTGTHGSGKNSLSHYVRAARVLQFDQDGKPFIKRIDSGPALNAIRCSLGCLGVITELELEIRQQYLVEEHFRDYATLQPVLNAETEFPLQQFYLIPWRWTFIAQHRREVEAVNKRFARPFSIYFHLIFDIGMHWIILAILGTFGAGRLMKAMFRWVIPAFVIRNWRVVDRSDRILTMEHEMFRHVEIELFVRRSQLPSMLEWTRYCLSIAAGETPSKPACLNAGNNKALLKIAEHMQSLAGSYTHHYPICVRKVLSDDTLISMTAGWDEPGYAVSLICYAKGNARDKFFEFARWLARGAIAQCGARLHWGKFNDVDRDWLLKNVNDWEEFKTQVAAADPQGVFQNNWTRELLADR